jgi:hypothetical protein
MSSIITPSLHVSFFIDMFFTGSYGLAMTGAFADVST